ncbi:MAG: tRNA lysidine(34) synthetase TilS [Nitrospiraceae bacterium]|nr:MAG: tRNA lysidine(34) synthetase TilS [Nitrospiraceae bacterium]
MKIIDRAVKTIKKHSMINRGDTILIGLSGGPDSVCLTVILDKLRHNFNISLHALYVNHGLRPDENTKEEAFCKELCERLGVIFHTRSVNVKSVASEKRCNVQETARELRYELLEDLAEDVKASKIAVGHNADDQAETIFMRLVRGSGRRGLSGILPVRGSIIRPLIEIERSMIETFLDNEMGHSFLRDSSNLNEDYLRNWLRINVMNEVKKHNPSLIKDLSRTADILREEDNYLEIIVTKTLMRLVSRKNDSSIELFLTPLEALEKSLLRRVLRRAIDATSGLRGISFVHVEDIIELIRNGTSGDRIIMPKGLRAIRNYATLKLTLEVPESFSEHILDVPGEIIIPEQGVIIEAEIIKQEIESDGRNISICDLQALSLPLRIRPRQDGDFFYPRGLGRKKKLQDFFVDEKVPRDERNTVPIVLSGNDIIWIAGFRDDERFKPSGKTEKILKLIISDSKTE